MARGNPGESNPQDSGPTVAVENPPEGNPSPDPGTTAEDFVEQPKVQLGGGPYVKFVATDRYTHKILDASDLRLAGLEVPQGLSVVEWNSVNGFQVPAKVFGEGGKENAVVKRLLADPSREFEFVE